MFNASLIVREVRVRQYHADPLSETLNPRISTISMREMEKVDA